MDELLRSLNRLLTSRAAEYVIAAAAIVVWLLVSRIVKVTRRIRGEHSPDTGGIDEPRPRRRLPL